MFTKPHFSRRLILLSLFLFLAHSLFNTSFANGLFGAKKERFLPPQQAFIFSAQANGEKLDVNWQIADGYYLYKREIAVENNGTKLNELALPTAENYHDEFFGEVEIYRNELAFSLPLQPNGTNRIQVHYQGCTSGFCYPPQTEELEFNTGDSANQNQQQQDQPQQSAVQSINTTEQLASGLDSNKFSILWFFVLGLGLAFTPCVLPMLPLLSSIVIGQKERPKSLRALLLSLVYVQGMALTYTTLGLLVVAIGLPFQIALQSPYVLIAFSILFIVLACSMFGLFTLQLPQKWQNKLNQLSQKQDGGAYWNVFLMGMIAGLVASPCVSAPLSGALLYVSQSGDFFIGGLSLAVRTRDQAYRDHPCL